MKDESRRLLVTKKRVRSAGVAFALMFGAGAAADAQAPAADNTKGGPRMSQRARGTFEVKLAPVADAEGSLASARMRFDKTFAGDLTGTSRGEMWTADTGVKGSAGYVAIEKVEGTLRGRSGSFTLLHQATMQRGGDFKMALVVVPDSGSGQLAGLSGTLAIIIADGKHSYEFDYTLPDAP